MGVPRIEKYKFPGIYYDGKNFLTKNFSPGNQVYGERLVIQENSEYRIWNSRRSKLSAMLHKGCKVFPLEEGMNVLYLGAASGTTASHVSDVTISGMVYCVEFSPRAFRDLSKVCKQRKNMIPILADANHPESYKALVNKVDLVYQDIAQRNQAEIFLKNIKSFLKPNNNAMIMVKARSIDVTAKPKDVFNEVEKELKKNKMQILVRLTLDPYEKDHASFIIRN